MGACCLKREEARQNASTVETQNSGRGTIKLIRCTPTKLSNKRQVMGHKTVRPLVNIENNLLIRET